MSIKYEVIIWKDKNRIFWETFFKQIKTSRVGEGALTKVLRVKIPGIFEEQNQIHI